MGRYGQAILTVVGTVVGAYFGYPALGAALGSLVGGLLFPQQLPTVQGPRLADISQTTASVGVPIPRGWGTFPSPGTVIWQGDIQEVIVSEDVGGKGGPSQTVETPTYYQDFAIGISDAEDPITGEQPIAGIRRIWANGKITYDRTPRGDDETDSAFRSRMVAADAIDSIMTVYLGTETQLPDPTIEAAEGVGNVSAFRGLAYVVFTGWNNKQEDGNRMPAQWKFEVYTSGQAETGSVDEYSNEVLYEWTSGADPTNSANENEWTVRATGADAIAAPGTFSSLSAAVAALESARGGYSFSYLSYQIDYEKQLLEAQGGESARAADSSFVFLHFTKVTESGRYVDHTDITYNPCAFASTSTRHINVGPLPFWSEGLGGMYKLIDWDGFSLPPHPEPWDVTIACGYFACLAAGDALIKVKRLPTAPGDPCASPYATSIPGFPGYCVIGGQVKKAGAFQLHNTFYNVLRKYNEGPDNTVEYPLNPARPTGHADDNQTFWEAAYQIAVAKGLMPAGQIYGIDYPDTNTFGYRRIVDAETISTNPVTIASIVRDLCAEAGMDPDEDIEVGELEDLYVIGYVRTRVMAARGAIDPLRSVGFFDGIESNRKLRFVRRGKGAVATLSDDDLGAYIQGDTAPSKITTRKLQDVELPRQVRVHYISQSRDYEPGEQSSPARFDTDAVNDSDIELPVVLTDDQAAQIAQVIWADYWNSRWVHEIQLDAAWHWLEPCDVINVPVDGTLQRMRIVTIADQLPACRKMSLNRDDDGSYVSFAVGSTPPTTTQRPVPVIGPVQLVLLDLPLLRDEDNEAGFYAAVAPLITDETYRGAGIFKSIDEGGSYQRVSASSTAVAMGQVLVPLGDTSPNVFDMGSELRVELTHGSLQSRTEAAVLSGANACAIGVHGRWEVVQFLNAEEISDNVWSLTGLLRGRRGTEHNIGTGITGDTFVMISEGGLVRVPMNISEIGASRLYKAVHSGSSLENTTEQSFTGAGEALKPFSVVDVQGERDVTSGDWTITWIRRGRIGQTLQSGVDVPVSEDQEDYEIEIKDSAGEVLRTVSSSVQTITYSAAQQITDFGATQVTLSIEIFQISAQVGRGYGTEATL